MEIVVVVDKMYDSGFCYGFEIDCGYYYFKYGQFDDMEMWDQEFFVLFYEIWIYYEFLYINQNNVKFVFYNLFFFLGDYVLFYFIVIGECNNLGWFREFYCDVLVNEFNGNDFFGGIDVMDNFNWNVSWVFWDY